MPHFYSPDISLPVNFIVVMQDLNVLGCIGWEVIILDECQRPTIASCFEQIKMLTASKRLLIISSQLKVWHFNFSLVIVFFRLIYVCYMVSAG